MIRFIFVIQFSNYYRNIQRSASEWRSVCQLKPEKPTKTDLMESCKRVGDFDADPNDILYQLIDLEQNPMKNVTSINVIATNMEFSEIKLNHKFNLTIFNPRSKTSHSFDTFDCTYLLELNCGMN